MQVTTSKMRGQFFGQCFDADFAVHDVRRLRFERMQLRDLQRLGGEVDAKRGFNAAPRHRIGQDAAAATDVKHFFFP